MLPDSAPGLDERCGKHRSKSLDMHTEAAPAGLEYRMGFRHLAGQHLEDVVHCSSFRVAVTTVAV